jgi:hypothetical protein
LITLANTIGYWGEIITTIVYAGIFTNAVAIGFVSQGFDVRIRDVSAYFMEHYQTGTNTNPEGYVLLVRILFVVLYMARVINNHRLLLLGVDISLTKLYLISLKMLQLGSSQKRTWNRCDMLCINGRRWLI